MNDNFEIINNAEVLCLRNKDTGEIVARHKPFGKKFAQYRRISINCNIIKEDEDQFPTDKNGCKANIYCLDDNFKIKWTIKMPMDNDRFPNPIQWDKKFIETKSIDGFLTLVGQDNPNTFTCSSWRGFTLTVDYQNGQTINTEFTK